MNNFDIPLLTQVATQNGAEVKESDSASNILQAWLRAEGGTPMPSDTPNDLIRRLCLARGVTPKESDSNIMLFQRLAGKPSGFSLWHCLQALLSLIIGSAIPRNLSITNLGTTTFTLNWLPGVKTVPAIVSYKIDFSLVPDFSTFVIQNFSVAAPATHFDCTAFTANTNYYIRMRTVNASAQTSGNSSTLAFTTAAEALPDAPAATDASTLTVFFFTANWEAVSGADSYRLDVATDLGFTAFVTGFNDRTVNDISEWVTGLSPGTTYYYRVRTVNGSGTSANSNVITTTTP